MTIRELIIQSGLGDQDISTITGLNRSTIWRIRTGKYNPRHDTYVILQKALTFAIYK